MRIPLSVIKHLLMIAKLSRTTFFLAIVCVCLCVLPFWVDMRCDSIKSEYRTNNISTKCLTGIWRKINLLEVELKC